MGTTKRVRDDASQHRHIHAYKCLCQSLVGHKAKVFEKNGQVWLDEGSGPVAVTAPGSHPFKLWWHAYLCLMYPEENYKFSAQKKVAGVCNAN